MGLSFGSPIFISYLSPNQTQHTMYATKKKPLTVSFRVQLLRLILDIDRKYPDINYGGCGRFAITLGEMLEALGYTVEYIMLCRNKECLADAQSNLNWTVEWNEYEWFSWDHVMIKVNGYYIDSEFIGKSVKYHKSFSHLHPTEPLDKDVLKEFIYGKYTTWNQTFEPRTMGAITKELRKRLKEIA